MEAYLAYKNTSVFASQRAFLVHPAVTVVFSPSPELLQQTLPCLCEVPYAMPVLKHAFGQLHTHCSSIWAFEMLIKLGIF